MKHYNYYLTKGLARNFRCNIYNQNYNSNGWCETLIFSALYSGLIYLIIFIRWFIQCNWFTGFGWNSFGGYLNIK